MRAPTEIDAVDALIGFYARCRKRFTKAHLREIVRLLAEMDEGDRIYGARLAAGEPLHCPRCRQYQAKCTCPHRVS